MKRLILFLFITFTSCKEDTETTLIGKWITVDKQNQFDGINAEEWAEVEQVGFEIGDTITFANDSLFIHHNQRLRWNLNKGMINLPIFFPGLGTSSGYYYYDFEIVELEGTGLRIKTVYDNFKYKNQPFTVVESYKFYRLR